MTYGFIYYTKNELTGRKYIGKVSARTLYSQWDYKGSGELLLDDIIKYGVENFTTHFLAAARDGEELSQFEKHLLKHYKIPNSEFYNKNLATSNGDQGDYFNKSNPAGANTRDIICYNIKTKETLVFNNIMTFCENYGFTRGCLFNVLSGQRITHKDCVFWYKDFPLSQDGLVYIMNYKFKTTFATKYKYIEEVKSELKELYDIAHNKTTIYPYTGYYIEDNKQLLIDFKKLKDEIPPLKHDETLIPKSVEKINSIDIKLTADDKFEIPRETEYILSNNNHELYFNYDEINSLGKIYQEINVRLLRQAISRKQHTVMSGKYNLKISGRDY